MDIIDQACIIDDAVSVDYAARDIHKINEYPDEPLGGTVLASMPTPTILAGVISSPFISVENFTVETLPGNINYRKMSFNAAKLK